MEELAAPSFELFGEQIPVPNPRRKLQRKLAILLNFNEVYSLIVIIQNPLQPDLGKAGSPYARTVPKMKHLHGVPPDPGLLFDCKPFLLPSHIFYSHADILKCSWLVAMIPSRRTQLVSHPFYSTMQLSLFMVRSKDNSLRLPFINIYRLLPDQSC